MGSERCGLREKVDKGLLVRVRGWVVARVECRTL
jgi:hypothetical protein